MLLKTHKVISNKESFRNSQRDSGGIVNKYLFLMGKTPEP